MADEQKSITMERNGVVKQVDPKLYKVAIEKGWKRQQAPAQATSQPPTQTGAPAQAQPQQSRLGRDYDKFIEGTGFNPKFSLSGQPGTSTNPFHTPPAGMDSHPGVIGGLRDVGEDVLNLREMGQLGKEGRKEEGFSMMAGTIAGLLGPKEMSALGKSMAGEKLGGRAALGMASRREAAQKAVRLVKQLRGNIKDAQLAEELVQPVREALNAKFELMHKALDDKTVKFSARAKQLIASVARTEPEMAKELTDLVRHTGEQITNTASSLSERVSKKTVSRGVKQIDKTGKRMSDVMRDRRYAVRPEWDYANVRKLITRFNGLRRESPNMGRLADELQKGVQDVAKAHGWEAEAAQLSGWYKQMNDIAAAAHTSVTRSALRALARKIPKVGEFVGEGGGKVGDIEIRDANRLFSEITGQVKKEATKKVGESIKTLGKAWQSVPPGYRALLSAFGGGSDSDGGVI